MGITTKSLDLLDDSQDVSSLSGDTQGAHFYPKRVQPLASEAIAAKRVVYLELHHILDSIINTQSNTQIDPKAKFVLNIKYPAISDYIKFQLIQDIIFYVEYLRGESKYTLDNVVYKAALRAILTCISNFAEVQTVRQRTISSTIETGSDMMLTWIALKAAIRTTIEVVSDMPPVDTMLLREGKLIIRVLTAYLDNLAKNFGRIVIEEDPFI